MWASSETSLYGVWERSNEGAVPGTHRRIVADSCRGPGRFADPGGRIAARDPGRDVRALGHGRAGARCREESSPLVGQTRDGLGRQPVGHCWEGGADGRVRGPPGRGRIRDSRASRRAASSSWRRSAESSPSSGRHVPPWFIRAGLPCLASFSRATRAAPFAPTWAPARRRPARPSASASATRSRCRRNTCASRAIGRRAARSTTASARRPRCWRSDGSIPSRLEHTVIFLWSMREEIGLEGARAAADSLRFRPVRVHAIDTFVSADSPLEPQAFAVAPLGRGPVARALDNSSVTPPAYLDSLVALARRARRAAPGRHHQRRERRVGIRRVWCTRRSDRLAASLLPFAGRGHRPAGPGAPLGNRSGGRGRLVSAVRHGRDRPR